MNVLVTGATGFLGRALVARLSAVGARPRALVRPTSRVEGLEALGVELAYGSLDDGSGIDDALRGIDAVVHCAGGGRVRCAEDFYRNNTATTATLVDAVLRAGVELQRFVLLSSMAARGPAPSADPSMSHVAALPITHYGRSKLAAELETSRLDGLSPVTILRPPGIYGPGDDRLLPLFRAATRGVVPVPAAAQTASFVYLDDCVEAVACVLSSPHPSGRVYYVEDGEPRSIADTARAIGRAVGRSPRVVRVPMWAFDAASVAAEAIGTMSRRPVLLTRDKVLELSQAHWVCDAGPLRTELGWRTTVTFDEGAALTASDYRSRGWIT